MKKSIRVIEMALCICAAFGWWGVLYPELTMMPDTYRIVRTQEESSVVSLPEEGEAGKMDEWDFDSGIYFEILQAQPGQVQFKSKFLMKLKEVFGTKEDVEWTEM